MPGLVELEDGFRVRLRRPNRWGLVAQAWLLGAVAAAGGIWYLGTESVTQAVYLGMLLCPALGAFTGWVGYLLQLDGVLLQVSRGRIVVLDREGDELSSVPLHEARVQRLNTSLAVNGNVVGWHPVGMQGLVERIEAHARALGSPGEVPDALQSVVQRSVPQ